MNASETKLLAAGVAAVECLDELAREQGEGNDADRTAGDVERAIAKIKCADRLPPEERREAHRTLLLECKAGLALLEAKLLEDDPAASTQMEWEAAPLPQIREALADAEPVLFLGAVDLETIVSGVRDIIWRDRDGTLNKDREWNCIDDLSAVADVLDRFGLRPTQGDDS